MNAKTPPIKAAQVEISKFKVKPDALLKGKRSYDHTDAWPVHTKNFLQPLGYDLSIDRRDGWIEFTNYSRSKELDTNGWKFHVSILAQDMAKAWDICFPVFVRYGISGKFVDKANGVTHARAPSPRFVDPNTGKMLVIYGDNRPPEFFLGLCQALEQQLAMAKIAPGQTVPLTSSRPLPGSKGYVFYRNDRDPRTNKYVRPNGYNPFNRPDPYVNGYNAPQYLIAKRNHSFLKGYEPGAYIPR